MSGPDALRRFRKLVDASIATTFLLVVVGGVVRVADAGLGCGPARSGLQGWPLCEGSLLPAGQVHSILEYSHRIVAAVVTVLLVAVLWQALRRLRGDRVLVRGAAAALVLVVVQALLGALTVEHGLPTVLVAAHLGLAMLLLGVLVFLALRSRGVRPAGLISPRLRAVAWVACALVLATIVSGGVIAGTEAHGTPGGAREDGAHTACGEEFPTCNGAFLPFGESEMVDIHLAHRTAMYLTVLVLAGLALMLRRNRLGGLALGIVLVLAAQVWLGALNVFVGKAPTLVVAHLVVGTLLWLLVVSTLPLSGPLTARAREP